MTYEENYLKHYGIKGQKWGTRRFQNEDGSYTAEGKERYGRGGSQSRAGVRRSGLTKGFNRFSGVYDKPDGTKDTKRLQKDAKKDAEDMARAKAYYGEGAGNRRKQIRNRISERMKDPDYKAEYEKQLAAQDMSKHQKAANRERHVQDAKNKASEIGNGLKNLLLGAGTTSLAAVAIYSIAKRTGADKKIAELGKKAFSDIVDKVKSFKKPQLKDFDWSKNRPTKYGSDDYTVSKSSYTVDKSQYTVPKSSYTTKNPGDIVEKTDRAKHGTQRPWVDKNGQIHYY